MDRFRDQWNNHGLSTEKGRTPLQLFTMGIARNANSQLKAVRDLLDSGGIPNSDPGVVRPPNLQSALGRTRVEVPSLVCPLTVIEMQHLDLEIEPLMETDDHGISVYLSAKQLIANLRNRNV